MTIHLFFWYSRVVAQVPCVVCGAGFLGVVTDQAICDSTRALVPELVDIYLY
ncbi:hypothetical protein [Mycobacteroides saopaulense]|uniref:hypothetical protein n=1 Tax=Mycobacteroides saopaulense TaxID=1578165 RepID=UPI0013FD8A9F|nr:hypothetical protein [Mycobacteroides saopaulense]